MPLSKTKSDKLNINGKIIIRNALKDDVPALLEIENNSFENSRLKKHQFIYLLKYGKCELIVCEIDLQVVGYVISLYRKNSTEARIYSIAVHPKFRSLGLGILLLNEISNRATKHSCKSIRLEMDTANETAKRFYKKMGFFENGMIYHYYGKNVNAIRFKIIL